MSFNTSEVLCSDWFIYNIKEHLVPKDFLMLKYVCKYYHKNITVMDVKRCIISNINLRLKKILGDNYDTFIKYISKHNVAISGSFIIQCILEEYYEDSDIDIYSYKYLRPEDFFKSSTDLIKEYSNTICCSL